MGTTHGYKNVPIPSPYGYGTRGYPYPWVKLPSLVDSPCLSSKNHLHKSHDDMLALSCCHDKNVCVPSNPCIFNNVEET